MNNNSFATRVKQLRINNNLTQKDVAEKMGMTPTGISYWEKGNVIPNYETLKKLADFFNVSIDFLTGNESANNENDVLFRKIGKVDEEKKSLLMRILNNTIDSFIDDENKF